MTPLEMASAYSAIPNGGVHEPPYFIERIEDRNGQVVYEHAAERHPGVLAQTAASPPRS